MQLNLCKNAEEHTNELIAKLKQIINDIDDDQITIGVSGGKSPIFLFEKLSMEDLPWHKIVITLVDERFVSEDDIDSNANLVRKHLLKNKAHNVKFISLCDGIKNYSPDNLNEIVIDLNKRLCNKIHIAILGMGEDGHTASIFPDCDEFLSAINTKQKYLSTTPQNATYRRITLSLSGLLGIPNLLLSISGKSKLNVIADAINFDEMKYPISHLLHNRKDVVTYWHQ